ncbi:hypothetical protein TNCV_192411 [Trichonephila clavipes]|nr:hypothetical protein TNCV_192411 [Trichonephila clavipes]
MSSDGIVPAARTPDWHKIPCFPTACPPGVATGSTDHCAPERVVYARWRIGTFFKLRVFRTPRTFSLCVPLTTIHLLAPSGHGEHVLEGRSKLDCWNRIRNVLLQFLKTMRLLKYALESSPQKVIVHTLTDQVIKTAIKGRDQTDLCKQFCHVKQCDTWFGGLSRPVFSRVVYIDSQGSITTSKGWFTSAKK